jgi:hypothetical protein
MPMSLQDCCIFYWEKIPHLWGVVYIIKKNCITLGNYKTHYSLLLFPDRWHFALLFSFIYFNQITPHPCLNATPFQAKFLSRKILQHSFLIGPVHLTVPQHFIFPVCKLLHKSGEDSKLSIPYTNRDHPCHDTVAFVVVIVNFCVIEKSIWVS